ncbi:MAG: ATP-binding protein [bacterium]
MDTKEKVKELLRSGAKLPPKVIERTIKRTVLPWLEREEIIVITGARQAGKSVFLYQLIYDYILKKSNNVYYFNLDIKNSIKFFEKPDNIINLVNKTKRKTYIIIDEVQRLKEPGLFLKGIYDLHLPVKIIVSGSSSLELKSKIHEPLTGRKILFHLNPFNLEEISRALYPHNDIKDVVEHYVVYGGYPAIVLAKKRHIKLRLLKELFESYLDKDVKSYLHVENETAFSNLIKILASQAGNLINKDELSQTLGIHKNTLDNYLYYLEETFILDLVKPFYKNPRKELLKNPKVYFQDLGLRNYAIGSFNPIEYRPDKGSIFENMVYLCLREKDGNPQPVNYWRTKTGAEVDFIIMDGLNPIPYEAKASELTGYKITKSLRSFIDSYKPKNAYCINMSFNGTYKIDKTIITFITPAEFVK